MDLQFKEEQMKSPIDGSENCFRIFVLQVYLEKQNVYKKMYCFHKNSLMHFYVTRF